MESTTEQNFLNKFLEYHREVTARFDKLEELIKQINVRQAIIESEGSKAAIRELTQKYYELDKRQILLERGLEETREFRQSLEADLKAIKLAQLSEEDLKMFRKGKAIFIVLAVIFGLFQIWQVVKDLGIIRLP